MVFMNTDKITPLNLPRAFFIVSTSEEKDVILVLGILAVSELKLKKIFHL